MGFSTEMRAYMSLWEEADKKERTLDQIKTMLDANNFVLFFKMANSIFGAPEESRVTFARMKNPDEDTDEGWLKEATFMAIDLDKALEGEKCEKIFYHKDLKEIKVVEREEAEKQLVKRTSNPQKIKKDLVDIKRDEEPGKSDIDEF